MQSVTQLVPSLSSSVPLAVASSSSCSATTSPSTPRGRCFTFSSSSSPLLIPLAPLEQAASVSGRGSSNSKLNSLWTDHRTSRPSRTNVIRGAAGGESAVKSTTQQPGSSSVGSDGNKDDRTEEEKKKSIDHRVKHVKTIAEFDEALIAAKKKLVVVEYAASHSKNSRKIYPAMVDMSKEFKGVVFLLVLGDESEDTKILCEKAGIKKVPHFVFYKNSEKIHEEEGITEELLQGDVLYYGDNDAPIYQVRNKADFEVLLNEHASDNKLVVLDVGLKSCGPCAKVYPTVVTLSKKMAENTIFARMHGDENSECASLLKSMEVKEVPTFVFIRDRKPLGRYVGSGRGELVGEILRYNGVRVTY